MTSESPSDSLYEVPPARFVEERNGLARDLARAGKKAEAAAVKALTKPTASVFAVNQAVRRAPSVARALLQATDNLRRAQADAGLADGYREAAAVQAEQVERLVELAKSALSEAGVSATEAVLERVANNLRWGALSAETRPALEAGRMRQDAGPPGFEVLAGATLRPAAPGARKPAPDREDRARVEALRAAAADARRAEAQARDEERTADVRCRRAEAHATALQDQLATAKREADAARTALSAAESLVAERVTAVARADALLAQAQKTGR